MFIQGERSLVAGNPKKTCLKIVLGPRKKTGPRLTLLPQFKGKGEAVSVKRNRFEGSEKKLEEKKILREVGCFQGFFI